MAAMEEGAKSCKCFLAIVTDNGQDSYFSRRDEIKWAQVTPPISLILALNLDQRYGSLNPYPDPNPNPIPNPNPNPNPKQVAERTIVPVCGADDKKNVMALINGGKEQGIDFSTYNMVDVDRSAPRRLKASVEDILEQAGML